MIQIVIMIAVVYPLIYYINKKKDGIVEGFSIATFVIVPALIVLLGTIAGGFMGLSPLLLMPLQLLYFVAPLLLSRFQLECTWGTSSLYAGIVFGVNILTSTLLVFLMGNNA